MAAESSEEEVWKVIESNPNYEISNLGRVKGVTRVLTRKDGTPYSVRGRIKKPRRNASKNLVVDLYSNNIYTRHQVNQLVARYFCDWWEEGCRVSHIDGDLLNCRQDNLRRKSQTECEKEDARRLSARRSHLRRYFGITPEIFQELLDDQDGNCKVCGRHHSIFRGTFHVDHSHKDGRIRGLLCNNCNKHVVSNHEDGELLRRAGDYIENSSTGFYVPEEFLKGKPRKRRKKK